MALLVDTGFIYALADRSDAWHGRAVAFLQQHPQAMLVPVTVVPEAAYLLRERLGAEAELSFARALARHELGVEELRRADWVRVEAILAAHPFLGLVDASVIAVAERLKCRELATTDRRHFGEFTPAHIPAFTLVP